MKQFILTNEPVDSTVRLEGGDYRYLVRVSRLAVGEYFPALLPNGTETLVQVLSISGGVLTGKCLANTNEAAPVPPEPQIPPIILFQAMPKGEKMDLIVRQAAEGGITEIVPFISEYSLSKQEVKAERWNRIIREARQQSGSKIATLVRDTCNFAEIIAYWEELKSRYRKVAGIFLHQVILGQESFHSALNPAPEAAVLAVGPEGGFSPHETEKFLNAGFKPVTMGPSILRAETAALYASAAARIILLESELWIPKTL